MDNMKWRNFFLICVDILGPGDCTSANSRSWCSFTTYRRLLDDAGYWTGGLPREEDVGDDNIRDGSVWGQPFLYRELAHLIILRRFYWENGNGQDFMSGYREQNLEALSADLVKGEIDHRLTELVLEMKLY